MLSAISNNCKDNSSVYSGSSANTESSASFCRNRRIIPRSNSTSDLYEIPSASSGHSRRKKQIYTGSQKACTAPGPRGVPRANSWTGDQYLLRGKEGVHNVVPHKPQPSMRQTMYKSQCRSNSSYVLESKVSLNSIPEKRQPNYVLTPYQLQRKQMRDPFQFPNGESFTPRSKLGNHLSRSSSSTALSHPQGTVLNPLTRSQSMNSLPLASIKVQKSLSVVTASASSPVDSGSSGSSYNSMRDHSSSGSTNLSSGPSAHSSNTALHLTVNEKMHSKLSTSIALTNDPNKLAVPVNRGSPMKLTPAKQATPIAQVLVPDATKNIKREKGDSKPKTKLGSFFRKVFSLSSSSSANSSASSSSSSLSSLAIIAPLSLTKRKKRKRNDVENHRSPVSSPISAERPVSSKQKVKVESGTEANEEPKMDPIVNLSAEDEENDDDCDDILMDTDLVFDSLLLKADLSRPSHQQKQIEQRQKLKDLPRSLSSESVKEASLQSGGEHKAADSNIDYELISEFSRLGTFIQESSRSVRKEHANLPPRSTRRPALPDKELAKSFYHPIYGMADNGHFLIRRLYQDWKVVHLDETFPVSSTKEAKDVSQNKRLRFAQEIYVNDTWSPLDYQRSDKRFIKNRRRMMQLENEGFIRAIKVELNEYKKTEMVVHQDSVRFTHLFL